MNLYRKLLFSAVAGLPILASAQHTDEQFIKQHGKLKINQIQVLGTHNSYAQPVDSNVINLVDKIISTQFADYTKKMSPEEKAKMDEFHPNGFNFQEALKYDHPDFPTQLNAGIRSLEIDVYNDPTGNRFNRPVSYDILRKKGITRLQPFDSLGMSKPGFKVMHMADIDIRSHYTSFRESLTALKDWSDAHPKHIPIFIMIEAKDESLKLFPNGATVLPFDEKAFDALDADVFSIIGRNKMITPDDVKGNYASLREAVLHQNWPTLESARGKFIFLLLPATAGLNIANTPYVKSHPNLKGRAMFVQSEPNSDYSAFLLLDNAIMREKEIKQYVKEGYIVRSRSDIETYEAKANDYKRADKTFSSGAQVVSTDFSAADRNTYHNSFVVKLPDNAQVVRPNPINAK